jgi:hypothetical protein
MWVAKKLDWKELTALGGVNNHDLWCEEVCSVEEKEWMLVCLIDLGT